MHYSMFDKFGKFGWSKEEDGQGQCTQMNHAQIWQTAMQTDKLIEA